MSRTKKKEYSGSKRFDKTCRNHGGCLCCKHKRTYFDKKRRKIAKEDEKEWKTRVLF